MSTRSCGHPSSQQVLAAGNGVLDPGSLSPGSARKVAWVCPEHGSWRARVTDRVKGTGCPECRREAMTGIPRIKRGLLRDERPELVAQLHPTRNPRINLGCPLSMSNPSVLYITGFLGHCCQQVVARLLILLSFASAAHRTGWFLGTFRLALLCFLRCLECSMRA